MPCCEGQIGARVSRPAGECWHWNRSSEEQKKSRGTPHLLAEHGSSSEKHSRREPAPGRPASSFVQAPTRIDQHGQEIEQAGQNFRAADNIGHRLSVDRVGGEERCSGKGAAPAGAACAKDHAADPVEKHADEAVEGDVGEVKGWRERGVAAAAAAAEPVVGAECQHGQRPERLVALVRCHWRAVAVQGSGVVSVWGKGGGRDESI